MAFREIGKGYEAMTNFCTVMNMPKPMTRCTYDNCIDEIHWAYIQEKEISLQKVAASVNSTNMLQNNTTKLDPLDCTVSMDGSWQTRGYSSINGVVTCMHESKCLDYEVLSKHCRMCARWRAKDQTSNEYLLWKANHKCPANHKGTSSSMESAGAINIFHRSVAKYNLRYTKYLGDGDSSSFSKIVESKPYGQDFIIKKLECIGHIQKRIGSRLRQLKIDHKGKKLTDGKGIAGKGRLTDSAINKPQNYFGIAIRSNTDSVYAMKKCIFASLFHNSMLEVEKRHRFCPRGKDSWCIWQKEMAEEKDSVFEPQLSLPEAIFEVLLPVYKDLTPEDLLNRCLHGKTQNANEALHGMIWQRCPKIFYSGRKVVEIAVASAVCCMNDGRQAIKNVMNTMALDVGVQATEALDRSSRKRRRASMRRQSEDTKRRRKQLRGIKKGWNDFFAEKEGESYAAGKF